MCCVDPEKSAAAFSAADVAGIADRGSETFSPVGFDSITEQLRLQTELLRAFGKAPARYIFAGEPGTGKSLAARMLGQMLKNAGVLQSGHVVECNASDLLSPYVGGTTIKTQNVCSKALDGVLILDEAYALASGDWETNGLSAMLGREAIDTIIRFSDANSGRIAVILAGYPEPMQRMLETNPAYARLFSAVIRFPEFSSEELAEMFARKACAEGFALGAGTKEAAGRAFASMKIRKAKRFGNAREVNVLFDRCKANLAQRMEAGSAEDAPESAEQSKCIITLNDMPGEIDKDI